MDKDLAMRWLLVLFIMGISLAGVAYAIYLFAFVTAGLVEAFLSGLFLLLVTVNAIFNTVGCYYYIASYGLYKFTPKKLNGPLPHVSIVVPVRNEEQKMLERNLRSYLTVDYPRDKYSVYVLDNSDEPSEALKAYCKGLGIVYNFMENPVKLKSYVLNKFLKTLEDEFIAIFDADEFLVDPAFLKDCLAEMDEKAGFVQTTKEFSNTGNIFADAVNVYYLFFYKFMQPVRTKCRSTMFTGSCGVIRKSVLEAVGGFPKSPTEDLAFAFRADLIGRGGKFIAKTYAYGAPVDSFLDYLAQQWRYTIGNMWNLYDYMKNIVRVPWNKHIHYIGQACGYMYLSVLFLFYTLVLVAFVSYDISMRSIYSTVLVPQYLELLAFSYIIAIVLLVIVGGRLYFGSFRMGLLAFFLNFAAAIVRTRALIVGALYLPTKFVMGRQVGKNVSLKGAIKMTLIETSLAAFLLVLSIISFLRLDMISGFWLFWYSWLFSCTFMFVYSMDVLGSKKPKPQAAPAKARA